MSCCDYGAFWEDEAVMPPIHDCPSPSPVPDFEDPMPLTDLERELLIGMDDMLRRADVRVGFRRRWT